MNKKIGLLQFTEGVDGATLITTHRGLGYRLDA